MIEGVGLHARPHPLPIDEVRLAAVSTQRLPPIEGRKLIESGTNPTYKNR